MNTDVLRSILDVRLPAADRAWLAGLWPTAGRQVKSGDVRAAFSGLGRRASHAPLEPDDARRVAAEGVVDPSGWDYAMLGRLGLLVASVAALDPSTQVELVEQVYLRGDNREQVAVLRSLVHLPEPRRFTTLAIESCRTNVLDVFAAIACENAFPAAYYPDLNFNQLVLKSIFMGLDTHRIIGLPARATAELRRMVTDFADERRAAGRPIPPDTTYIQSLAAR